MSGFSERQLINSSKLRKVENLPGNRLKIPIGIRLNYYASDFLVLRSYYRFYKDDFGLIGNTFNIETALKIGPFLSLIPFYRYHTQISSDYYQPFGQHFDGERLYYTSDNDLAGLHSNKLGLGIRYSPVFGIGRMKLPCLHDGSLLTLRALI